MKFATTLILFLMLFSCSKNDKKQDYSYIEYPTIISKPKKKNYFGIEIIDPYRNLEDLKDSTNLKWLQSQSNLANTVLNKIKGKDSLFSLMKNLNTRQSYNIKKTRLTKNEHYFYLKKNPKEDYYRLYYKDNFTAKEEFLFDPRTYNTKSGNKYTINYIKPSWNSKYIAIAMSYDGKELSDMVILDMTTRKLLPEVITNCWPSSFWGINWLPDNTGFTYLHFPETDPKDEQFLKNTKTVLYTLNSNPKDLVPIFTEDDGKTSEGHPITIIKSLTSKYIIGYFAGVDNYWDAYYTEIASLKEVNPKWKPLYNKEDKIYRTGGVIKNEQFIYKTAKTNSNYTLASVDLKTLNYNNPTILIDAPEDETIENFYKTDTSLFYNTLKNGVEAKLYQNNLEIKLPKTSGQLYMETIEDSNNFWIYISGWSNSEERYKYNVESQTFINQSLSDSGKFPEFDNLVVKEVLVASHDGELVPLSIIYDTNTKMDGTTPVLLDGYGAYGDNNSPYFSPMLLSFVTEGGILATAHVRGGGEKGEAWRLGGFKTTKPNTWKDVIACAEYLTEKKYTSNKHIALLGGSAGAIMAGNAMIERPDLFAASIMQVGQLNPLRYIESDKGGTNYKEFGNVKDSVECMALIAMDPYLKIKKDVSYPAVLLTAGMNDTRIPAWLPGKFAAHIQSGKISNPILFDVQFDSGHSGGSDFDEVYDEWANVFSFAFWQAGHPEYQLKEVSNEQ